MNTLSMSIFNRILYNQ